MKNENLTRKINPPPITFPPKISLLIVSSSSSPSPTAPMKWEMEIDEIEAVLEKIWDLHDKLSDAIHSISRDHFIKTLKKPPDNDNKKKPFVDQSDENRQGYVFIKGFRVDDEGDSAIREAKSLNSIRTALENLEDQLEFLHVSKSVFGFFTQWVLICFI